MLLPLLVVLSTVHLEGDVPVDGGDYVDVPFEVPAGTREIHIVHDDGSDTVILDWGVWGPDGFRGWGGGNTEDAVIGVDQSSRSYLPGPITPGMWTVSIGKAHLDATGGHYAIDVTCTDTETLPVRDQAAFSPVVLNPERRWYKGDFHVHSSESGDANASLDQIATLAKQRGLDFVNLSDHNTSSHLALAAAVQPTYPDVLLLRGAEITTYAGHGNAVGLSSYVEHRIGYQGRTIGGVLDDVTAQGALFIVNHPSLDLGDNCIGCAWNHPDTPWDKVSGIEIITGKWDVVERLFVPRAIALWDQLLTDGHRIAAIGGSDDHRAGTGTGLTDTPLGSPTTLVLADGLSEAAIMEGIRKGRTIVQLRGPDDPFLDVHVVRADGTLAEIGDDVDGVATMSMPVTVTGGAGTFLQLWRDGEKLAQVAVTSDAFTHTFEDVPGAADHRYRLELSSDVNQRLVVTSHFYVHGVEETGCGCRSGGDAWVGVPWVLLLLLRKRRRH
ncbi:MAG TPA: CehA/McbA family metallohydrolase [Kofleriaceae bacterium]|nr:CehA/McbA family metallohydrolase [Kofleriaceae bacterium]